MNNLEILNRINRLMAQSSGSALGTLMAMLNNPETSEATRAKVAIAILDHTYKFMALTKQEETIAELEAMVSELEGVILEK